MRLVHFSRLPLPPSLFHVRQPAPLDLFKPRGLWVSDEDEYGWRAWCEAEQFRLDCLKWSYRIELKPASGVLLLPDVAAVDAFTERFGVQVPGFDEPRYSGLRLRLVDWQTVARLHTGVLCTPYDRGYRLDGPLWYNGWDCASGCIWDRDAIASVRLTGVEWWPAGQET